MICIDTWRGAWYRCFNLIIPYARVHVCSLHCANMFCKCSHLVFQLQTCTHNIYTYTYCTIDLSIYIIPLYLNMLYRKYVCSSIFCFDKSTKKNCPTRWIEVSGWGFRGERRALGPGKRCRTGDFGSLKDYERLIILSLVDYPEPG